VSQRRLQQQQQLHLLNQIRLNLEVKLNTGSQTRALTHTAENSLHQQEVTAIFWKEDSFTVHTESCHLQMNPAHFSNKMQQNKKRSCWREFIKNRIHQIFLFNRNQAVKPYFSRMILWAQFTFPKIPQECHCMVIFYFSPQVHCWMTGLCKRRLLFSCWYASGLCLVKCKYWSHLILSTPSGFLSGLFCILLNPSFLLSWLWGWFLHTQWWQLRPNSSIFVSSDQVVLPRKVSFGKFLSGCNLSFSEEWHLSCY